MRILPSWFVAGIVLIFAVTRAEARELTQPDTLTLPLLERLVVERNPSLAAARAAWREAEARARQAGALEDPMVDLMVAPRSLASDAVDPAYRVTVTQRLPLFGQRGLRRTAGRFDARAAALDHETAKLDLLREIRTGFYEYYRVVRSQEINRELVELMRQFEHAALAKYAAGLVAQVDPLQAGVELAMLSHQAIVLERERTVVVALMNALLHQPPASALPPPPRELPLPDSPSTELMISAEREQRWPELRAAEARVEARRAEVALTRRERLPEGSLGVSYDRFWSEPELRTTLGLSLNLPLYPARRRDAAEVAYARLAAAESERDAGQDRVDLEIETASADFRVSRHEFQIVRDDVLPAAERTVKAARAGYEANRSDFLALINATRDLARARVTLHDTVARLNQAHAKLKRALAVDAPPREKEVGR